MHNEVTVKVGSLTQRSKPLKEHAMLASLLLTSQLCLLELAVTAEGARLSSAVLVNKHPLLMREC